ncbi:MAG TPA: CYTH domain-containing protein, partial [Thermoanaerobaculia bacterium]|nr:CYTH domain-containing protein [Thermoanaerobaculia bacterium]
MPLHEFRCDVPDEKELERLLASPLPLSLRSGAPSRAFHRDVYVDTPDGALKRRRAACRLRLRADDRRFLTLFLNLASADGERLDAEVAELDPRRALDGATEPARRLRGLVDHAHLRPSLEIETERVVRGARGALLFGGRYEFMYETNTVRSGALARSFRELRVRRLRAGSPALADIERSLGLRTLSVGKRERAEQLLTGLESEALVRAIGSARLVAVLALDGRKVALLSEGGTLALPSAEGSGEDACRHLLREKLGSGVADLRLLGVAPAAGRTPAIEVWTAERLRREAGAQGLEWLPFEEALARAGSPALRDATTLAALTVAARSDVFDESSRPRSGDSTAARRSGRVLTELPQPALPPAALDTRHDAPEQF